MSNVCGGGSVKDIGGFNISNVSNVNKERNIVINDGQRSVKK